MSGIETGPVVYQVRIPAQAWLTSNKTSSYRYGRRAWRDATSLACRIAKLPVGLPVPVTIHLMCWWTGRNAPVRDRLNLQPTVKAIVDGLTPLKVVVRKGVMHTRGGYGLLVDDDDRHVRDTTWELRRSTSGPAWVDLTVTEVTDGNQLLLGA